MVSFWYGHVDIKGGNRGFLRYFCTINGDADRSDFYILGKFCKHSHGRTYSAVACRGNDVNAFGKTICRYK